MRYSCYGQLSLITNQCTITGTIVNDFLAWKRPLSSAEIWRLKPVTSPWFLMADHLFEVVLTMILEMLLVNLHHWHTNDGKKKTIKSGRSIKRGNITLYKRTCLVFAVRQRDWAAYKIPLRENGVHFWGCIIWMSQQTCQECEYVRD